jgi:hypothetical protein
MHRKVRKRLPRVDRGLAHGRCGNLSFRKPVRLPCFGHSDGSALLRPIVRARWRGTSTTRAAEVPVPVEGGVRRQTIA